jgi:hypothetical protein
MQKALLIVAATTFVVGPAMVLPTMPILAENQTSVDQTAAPGSLDVMCRTQKTCRFSRSRTQSDHTR